jgi:hypothetical protein
MAHAVLPKSKSNSSPQSLTAVQMDPHPHQLPAPQPTAQPSRKRKKSDLNDEPSEPRRLRRSHEACARCRSKKIKASAVARGAPAATSTLASYLLRCFYTLSATQSIQDVPLVRMLALLAIKRTDIDRLSLREDIQSASSAN